MPKKKTNPDPLAKVSAPNLRRLVKRQRAEIERLRSSLELTNDHNQRLRESWSKLLMWLDAEERRVDRELRSVARMPTPPITWSPK